VQYQATGIAIVAPLVLVLILFGLSTAVLSQPSIEFDEPHWNFGRLEEGEMATHTYRFRNKGNKPLVISEVETTCGCTAALLSDSLIDPGGASEIKVTFNSRGRAGDQLKHVNVYTNDPQHKTVGLSIEGYISVYLRVSPRTLNFGEVSKGESKTLTVTLMSWDGIDFEILDTEAPSKYFLVQTSGTVQSWARFLRSIKERMERKFGNTWAQFRTELEGPPETANPSGAESENARILAVTLSPSAPLGQHSGRLKIHTNVKEKPVIEVALYASIVGDLTAVPKNYSFGSIKRGESKETVFSISSRSKRAFRVTSLESNSKYATAELIQTPERGNYQVKVKVSPHAPVGQLTGTITVCTDDRDQPEIGLLIYGRVTD